MVGGEQIVVVRVTATKYSTVVPVKAGTHNHREW
jgi:hypothetical protein